MQNSTVILKVCGMVIDKYMLSQYRTRFDQYCNFTSQKETNKEILKIKSDSISNNVIPTIGIFPNPFETQAHIQFDKNLNGANLD